jgi:hypothetical protein
MIRTDFDTGSSYGRLGVLANMAAVAARHCIYVDVDTWLMCANP